MAAFGVVLKAIITFAIVRALVAIGLGVVTYGAVLIALNNMINELKLAYNGMPTEVLNFVAIAGVPQALGIILGAVVAASALAFAKRIAFMGS